jgi:hypothetical protein
MKQDSSAFTARPVGTTGHEILARRHRYVAGRFATERNMRRPGSAVLRHVVWRRRAEPIDLNTFARASLLQQRLGGGMR